MTTLKIEIPKGYMIDTVDNESGEVKFKPLPKDVISLVKTVEDLLAEHGLTKEEFDEQCKGLSPDEVAYRIIKMLVIALNEGWVPDWNDSDQYKYFPWFYMGGSAGFRFNVCDSWDSYVGSRLCFKSRELAEHAGRHFTEVYKQFMIIS